jgi:hypothetical protein
MLENEKAHGVSAANVAIGIEALAKRAILPVHARLNLGSIRLRTSTAIPIFVVCSRTRLSVYAVHV